MTYHLNVPQNKDPIELLVCLLFFLLDYLSFQISLICLQLPVFSSWLNLYSVGFLHLLLFLWTRSWHINVDALQFFDLKGNIFSIMHERIKVVIWTSASITYIRTIFIIDETAVNYTISNIFYLHLRGLVISIFIHTLAKRPLETSSEFSQPLQLCLPEKGSCVKWIHSKALGEA